LADSEPTGTGPEEQLFVFRPEDHFKRFLESAKLMCMQLPYSAEQLVDALTALMRKEGYKEDCYIRPLAFFGDEIIGVRLHDLHTEFFDHRAPIRTLWKQ
jgi:branched-chain amino acid aminotransferase